MGSGNNRKDNDAGYIKRVTKKGTGSGGASGSQGNDINYVCPMAFVVKTTTSKQFPENTLVTVKSGDMFVLSENIGSLSKKEMNILTECGANGIHYTARITKDPYDRVRVRFEQNVKG